MLTSRIIYSLLFYILAVLLIFVSKPTFMFGADGEVKPHGVGEGKTVFSLGVFVVVMAIASFYIFALLDMIFGK